MKVYHYKEITVTQLAQESGYSRKTFYRLFEDKDDVLTVLFDALFAEFIAEFLTRNVCRYWDIVALYFDFWETRKDKLHLLEKNGLLPRMFENVYRHSKTIFVAMRSSEKAKEFSEPLPYLLAYSVGGMHSMLIRWVELGMTVSSTELIAHLKASFQSPDL